MTDKPRPQTLADLEALVGVELGPSPWRTVDQATIDQFADVTDDHQWIHVDEEKAAASPLGSTIAHGVYTLSCTPAMMADLMSFDGFTHALNYGYDKVRFLAPLPVNSRFRMRSVLNSVTETQPGQYNLKSTLTVEAEGIDKPILVAESIGRFSS